MGGLTYAVYYIGIPICGFLIVRLRHATGSNSLAEYVSRTYGSGAASRPRREFAYPSSLL